MLYGRDRRTIYELDRELNNGGEGIVYALQGRPSSVAKIYRPERISDPQLRERTKDKILAMLDMQFNPHDSRNRVFVAWPEDALFGSDGRFQGFVMPRIENMKSLIWASRPADREVLWPQGYRWRSSITIAYNLALTIEYLHNAGIIIGDMNTNNILIDPTGNVTLIDADSFNITSKSGQTFKCIVGFPEVLPPELQGKDLRRPKSVFSEKTDCFSLAIHIFCLLCNNCHPFGCLNYNVAHGSSSAPRIMDNIVRGYCPYVSASPARTVDDALDMDVFPADLRRLFERAFRYDMATGVRRSTIDNRPSAEEWRMVLGNLYHHMYKASGVAVCRRNPLHEFPSYYQKGCPWCAINQRKKSPPVADPTTVRTPVPPNSWQGNSHRPPLRQTNSKRGGLWAGYDHFVSRIGLWFKNKAEDISGYTAFVLFVIGAIRLVVDVVHTWNDGHPFSAIISAVIGLPVLGIIAYISLIPLLIVCYACRLVFKNATSFTIVVLVALGIYCLSTNSGESGKFWDNIRYRKVVVQCDNCGAQYNVNIRRLGSVRYCPCPQCDATIDLKQWQSR